jgi:hypothetical protein
MEGTEVPTPVTTTETPSASAPATAAPSVSPSTSQRPATMREAFEQVAAAEEQAATPPEGSATTEQVAPPDPTAVPDPSVNPSADAKGPPIPLEVHRKALDNARVKAVAEFREQSGIDKAVKFAGQINESATGFWKNYTQELLAHPEHGQVLRSELGRMFGSIRQPVTPQAEPMPEPDVHIVDAQGNVTGKTYSAEQLAKRDAWNRQQVLAEVSKDLQPIKAERAKREADAQAAETAAKVTAATDQHLTRIDKILDGRKDLYAQVNALMAADDSLDALDAAFQVREQHIVPGQGAEAQRKALESIKQKAAGNTGGHAGAATPLVRPKSERELAEFMRGLER